MKVYPTQVECIDDSGEVVFRVETFDEHTASIKLADTVVSEKSVDELFASLRTAFTMLDLK